MHLYVRSEASERVRPEDYGVLFLILKESSEVGKPVFFIPVQRWGEVGRPVFLSYFLVGGGWQACFFRTIWWEEVGRPVFLLLFGGRRLVGLLSFRS